jgi:succinyl-CoA synthetase beta subunit
MEVLTEDKAQDILKTFVPVAKSKLVKKYDDALIIAKKFKFPVVIKIMSKQALHKTEVGGVKICCNEDGLNQDFHKFLDVCKKNKIQLDGVLVQEMLSGVELIMGLNKDPVFGHVIMFGIGGTLVEVLKDVTFRMCPINNDDVESMIQDLRTKEILYGVRGNKGINFKILKKTLVNISKLPVKYPNISELDINPFIINHEYGKVADARIVFH